MVKNRFDERILKGVLTGKTLCFLGSSVTYGYSADGYSMCDYLEKNYGCSVYKWAVSGTTLCNDDLHSYCHRLYTDRCTCEKCDIFVCQLSTNDVWQNKPVGTISGSFDRTDFDQKTVIGAIEFIVCLARETWDCPVVFYTGTKFESTAYAEMISGLYCVRDKWGIEILDLWNDEEMNAVSREDYNRYMSDPVHPNIKGYDEWWGPVFAQFLAGILSSKR